MTVAESLAALWVLGVDVDMSETDLYNAVYKLVEFGFGGGVLACVAAWV